LHAYVFVLLAGSGLLLRGSLERALGVFDLRMTSCLPVAGTNVGTHVRTVDLFWVAYSTAPVRGLYLVKLELVELLRHVACGCPCALQWLEVIFRMLYFFKP